MNTKRYVLICILLALASYCCTRVYPNNKTALVIGIIISVIALLVAIFKIVLKDQSPKRLSYMIILVIGACFLAFGLYF